MAAPNVTIKFIFTIYFYYIEFNFLYTTKIVVGVTPQLKLYLIRRETAWRLLAKTLIMKSKINEKGGQSMTIISDKTKRALIISTPLMMSAFG